MESSDLLSNFIDEPSSTLSTGVESRKSAKLAPKFLTSTSNRHTLADDGSEQELMERLSNISSQLGFQFMNFFRS